MAKYVKVMYGTTSSANKKFNYKINEVNISKNWNPLAKTPEEMGGFNFSTEDQILRWLIRGDTIYDVEIPSDAEVIDCPNKSTLHGVFRSNKIILHNPRIITDDMALDLYKKSKLPEIAYYKSLAICAIKGYKKTCLQIINDKVTKQNIDLVLSEINDFVSPYQNSVTNKDKIKTYEEIIKILKEIKKYYNE